jgi:hypothetical protein
MRSVVLFKALQFRRHETSPFVVILLLLATEKQSVFVSLDVVFPVPGCYLYVTQSLVDTPTTISTWLATVIASLIFLVSGRGAVAGEMDRLQSSSATHCPTASTCLLYMCLLSVHPSLGRSLAILGEPGSATCMFQTCTCPVVPF